MIMIGARQYPLLIIERQESFWHEKEKKNPIPNSFLFARDKKKREEGGRRHVTKVLFPWRTWLSGGTVLSGQPANQPANAREQWGGWWAAWWSSPLLSLTFHSWPFLNLFFFRCESLNLDTQRLGEVQFELDVPANGRNSSDHGLSSLIILKI